MNDVFIYSTVLAILLLTYFLHRKKKLEEPFEEKKGILPRTEEDERISEYLKSRRTCKQRDIRNKCISSDIDFATFPLAETKFVDYKNLQDIGVNNWMMNNPVIDAFFSEENMDKVQDLLKQEIQRRTQGMFKIEEDQDENDLLIAMRGTYMIYGKGLPTNIQDQIDELNYRTVDTMAPDMITEIKQRYGYLRDIAQPLRFMPLPLNVSKAGRRGMPSITTVWR